MDIILVCPRNPELDKVSLDSVYSSGLKMVPLGLFYIATVLENHGFEVEIVDFNTARDLEECDVFIKNIVQEKPKIIGISVSTTTYPGGKAIAKKLREYLGDEVVFVWGGLHVTFLPEEPLQEGLAGIIVRGEGEYVMLEIARTVIEKNLNSITSRGSPTLKMVL